MNWKKLMAELQKGGYTQTRIAELCGVAQSSVSDLARGKTTQPGFTFGTKLLELRKDLKKMKEAA